MKSFTSFFRNIKNETVRRIYSLTRKEFFIFLAFVGVFLFGFIGFLNSLSSSFSVRIPTYGGTISEGVLGTPRFINPILASSDVDQSLTKIIYSGLVRKVVTPDGLGYEIVPDLAESYEISEDGKVYTFTIRENAVFHDKKPVTANDVVFTIRSLQDTRLQSPQFSNWFSINVQALDQKTVQITLPRAFSGFLETATLGILPSHIWETLSTEEFLASNRNTLPVGSGPYSIKSIKRDRNGTPIAYTLKSFKKFTLQKPYIQTFVMKFYPNEETLLSAYQKKSFDMLGNIRPYEISQDTTRFTLTTPLPRMFGIFLNTEKSNLLKESALRNALQEIINKDEIIQTVFQGYARSINHPLPELLQSETVQPDISRATQLLDQAGWRINPETGIRTKNNTPLAFTLTTADTTELTYTAQIIQRQLRTIGIDMSIETFQLGDLENTVIKSRSFDALLFGQYIRNDADIFAFWHSTQTSDPGLNITGFSNRKLDSLIEQLFVTLDQQERFDVLNQIQQEISSAPVIWIYQPYFILALQKPVYGIQLQSLITKNDRYNLLYQWYKETDTVWKFFNK